MNNSILEASHSGSLAHHSHLQGRNSGGPDGRTEHQARLSFLMESAAYLGLELGRDELVRRFLSQPAGSRPMAEPSPPALA
jgi:hypothetical protein